MLEGYAYGSRNTKTLTQLAETTGVLKAACHKGGIAIDIISPTELKKTITGSSKADKNAMLHAFWQNTGWDINGHFGKETEANAISPVSDCVDAYFLALHARAMHSIEQYEYETGSVFTGETK